MGSRRDGEEGKESRQADRDAHGVCVWCFEPLTMRMTILMLKLVL